MKHLAIFLFISLLSITSFSQKKLVIPDLKAGIGYPFVFNNVKGNSEHYTINGLPTVSVEMPFAIEYKRRNRFSINPGVAYYFFKEDEVKGNINYSGEGTSANNVVGKDTKLNHQSLSAYSKFLYNVKFQGRSQAYIYMGLIAGFHLITKTKGTRTIYSNNVDNPKDELLVNENAKDFFGPFYYGGVIGFQPNAKTTNQIKPSFEVKFYPGLVKRNTGNNFENESIVEFCILLGFRK